MRQSLIRNLLLAALVVTAAVFLQACKNASGEEDADQEEEITTIPVEAVDVAIGDVAAFYSGTAALEADRRAVVVAQTTGVILEILAEEGDYVEADQVLARIEPERYRLEARRTAAQLKRLETDYERKSELFGRKLVSAEDYEQVRADYEGQKAQHDLAQLNLYYTDIRAPISGYVSERLVRVGNLISTYQAAFNVTSYDPLLAVLHVPEREVRVLRKGLTVSVAVDAWPDHEFTGEVTRISPVIDADTGTFRVTAEISDESNKLKPGLFGRVQVLYDMHASVPVIPRSAIISEDDENHVFVVAEDGVASRRAISLGYEREGLVEVIDGLSPGERVVTAGKGSLNDGANVEVIGNGV
jgi:membrane fusion protein (multidrug efflux system)